MCEGNRLNAQVDGQCVELSCIEVDVNYTTREEQGMDTVIAPY